MARFALALAGGGTGGHVVPGVHVLSALPTLRSAPAAESAAEVLWFGAGRPVEDRVFAASGDVFAGLRLERVPLRLEPPGGGAPSLGRLLCRSLPETLRARRALARHRSRVLLGLGGFTVLPAVLAARSLGLPVALLEINATAGRATRVLRRLATRVFHAWPATSPGEERDVVVGPPLAPAFVAAEPDEEARAALRAGLGFAPEHPLLVVLGGSQGAAGLNGFLQAHAQALLAEGIGILHQVGPGRLDEAAAAGPGYRAVEYLEDVPAVLDAATVVLCGGGASTLAEVGARARPAWVVPYPHHPDEHQERNASQLGDGVALKRERELDGEACDELVRLCKPQGRERREAMAHALRGRVPRDAAERIARELFALANFPLESAPRIR